MQFNPGKPSQKQDAMFLLSLLAAGRNPLFFRCLFDFEVSDKRLANCWHIVHHLAAVAAELSVFDPRGLSAARDAGRRGTRVGGRGRGPEPQPGGA